MAYNFDSNTGLVIADESTNLAEVQQEYRDLFGADFDVTETSPQGKLIASETLARTGIAENNASVANQINPNISEGVFLDSLWGLLGGQRRGATRSTFSTSPTITGTPGAIIPAGVQAQTSAGDIFESVGQVTIGAGGTAQINFQAVETGPIPAAIGALNSIVTNQLGWETINNTVAATIGRNQETDLIARRRRRDTVGLNARTGVVAIVGALRDVDDVLSVSVRSNISSEPQTIDGILIGANTTYSCVDGGTDAAIGQALLNKVAGGDYQGSTEVDVLEPVSGQTYTTRFDRPTNIDVAIRVTVSAPNSINDPESVVRASVLAYANGDQPNDPGFILGADVAPFEIASAVNQDNPTLFVRLVEVSLKTDPLNYQSTPIEIAINQKAIIDEADIEVVIV